MRLWPYQMLNTLPTQYLLGQWRECLAISGMIKKGDGKVNHSTINRINDYPIEHFAAYCDLVRKEFGRRNFTIGTNTIEKLNNNIDYESLEYALEEKENSSNHISKINTIYILTPDGKKEYLFKNFHNNRYIKQCVYKFQEFYDTGAINKELWNVMCEKFKYLDIEV